jgi:SAM-dependent methyltransferase
MWAMDPTYTRQYETFEKQHWWYRARREIIQSFLDTCLHRNGDARWLDVGCGTGVLLESYGRIDHKMGLELDRECVERGREKRLNIVQSEAPWDFRRFGSFDLVTLCDVIEHVANEREAVRAVWDALSPGGIAVVTVPALKSLWSGHDVINHHFRRYSRAQLLRLFEPDRWRVMRSSYFSSFLFPAIWTARQLKNRRERREQRPPTHDFAFGPQLLDEALFHIFRMEKRFLRWMDLPIGSSLILVASKRVRSPASPAQRTAAAA